MQRHTFLAALATLALAATGLIAPSTAIGQTETLRIGFLTVRSGPLAAGGRQMEEGIQLFLKERNNTLAGRKVELIIADTGGNPQGAKTRAQELVERNNVSVIIGPLATFEALAIDDYIKHEGAAGFQSAFDGGGGVYAGFAGINGLRFLKALAALMNGFLASRDG